MNDAVHQLIQVILQGVTWVLRTIERIWVCLVMVEVVLMLARSVSLSTCPGVVKSPECGVKLSRM